MSRFASRLSDISEVQKSAESELNEKIAKAEESRSNFQTERATHEAGISFSRERIEKIDEETAEIRSILENASQNTNKYNRKKKQEKAIQDEFDKVDWDSVGENLEKELEDLKNKKVEIEEIIETAESNEEPAKRFLLRI